MHDVVRLRGPVPNHGFNPLPDPEFLLEAPGRSSDPSEAVEVAPGVPGRSPWCPSTARGRFRSAAVPGAAPNTFFCQTCPPTKQVERSAQKPFRIGKPCCQFVRSACARVSAVLRYKYSPAKHAAGHLRCLDNLLYRRRAASWKSLSAKMILTLRAPAASRLRSRQFLRSIKVTSHPQQRRAHRQAPPRSPAMSLVSHCK